MHFIWKDRKNNRSDEVLLAKTVVTGSERLSTNVNFNLGYGVKQDSDLIVFPEEAEFRKVKQTDQRVFMLVFKGSNKKFFFWMQEVSPAFSVDFPRAHPPH